MESQMTHHRLKPLSDQTIVVTGGTSGIGLCTALEAARRGAHVILVSRNEEMLKEVVHRIRRKGGQADYCVADVGDRAAVRQAVNDIVTRHGGFDTWVNNAGVGIYASLEETSDEDHERIFRTNYFGVVNGSLEALKHLKRRGGALINIGSISSEMPAPVLSAYTASKHAVKGFTDSLRLELIHEGAPVSVTLIKPSGIHSPFGQHAKNYMDGFSKVPPPVYHPRLVANAILHAAEHPTRDILVGAAGALQVKLAHLLPKLADRLFAFAFYRTAVDRDRPKRQGSRGLHQSASEGRILGDQSDSPVSVSPYTWAQMHPAATAAMVVGGAAVAGALIAARSGDGQGRNRQRLAHRYR
jgi:short-subunit dehydrogenase